MRRIRIRCASYSRIDWHWLSIAQPGTEVNVSAANSCLILVNLFSLETFV